MGGPDHGIKLHRHLFAAAESAAAAVPAAAAAAATAVTAVAAASCKEYGTGCYS